ncbi:MAG: ThiF family adenylyltransferase [Apilactobacillus sp.]|uniref:ThiF family adenylyltransferase n=1 Tax=Apilactobacillus kunkeei TaxID=148814 RepID=UPI0030EADA8F|nr:ThiF family adenylyltransferase [Apilactobacillus sp.]
MEKENKFVRVVKVGSTFRINWGSLEKTVSRKELDDLYKVGLNVKNVFGIDGYDIEDESINNEFFKENDININILESTIMIIGLGALGSKMLQDLVLLGFKNFIIVDADKVDESNLNRQTIYTRTDIGKYKIDSAFQWVKNINPSVSIKKFRIYIHEANDIYKIINNSEKPKLIIKSYDQPSNHMEEFSHFILENQIPFIMGGVTSNDIVIGPSYVPSLKNKAFKKLIKHNIVVSPMKGKFPAVNFQFEIISGLLTGEAINILHGSFKGLRFNKKITRITKKKKIHSKKILLLIINLILISLFIMFKLPWIFFSISMVFILILFKLDNWSNLLFTLLNNIMIIIYGAYRLYDRKENIIQNAPIIWTSLIFISFISIISMVIINRLGGNSNEN